MSVIDLKTYLQPGMKFFFVHRDGEKVLHQVVRCTSSQLESTYRRDGKDHPAKSYWSVLAGRIMVADIRTPLTYNEEECDT
jgi:hypothetical protein